MISVPCRTTTSDDFTEQIAQTITQDYFQPASSFQKDLDVLKSLRSQITLTSDEFVNKQTLQLYTEYFETICAISQKFPDDVAEFTWFSTLGYSTGPGTTLKSLNFEKVNLVYNIGAINCQLAHKTSLTSDENYKNATRQLQVAAGCFQYAIRLSLKNESARDTSDFGGDLSLETLNFLQHLMIAQAQELVWHKGAHGLKLNDSVVARLAWQVALYYEECLKFVSGNYSIRSDWTSHVRLNLNYFKAQAQYRQALVCQSKRQYGEALCRLQIALQDSQTALSFAKHLSKETSADVKELKDTLQSFYQSSEKDNDFIYLQVVPAQDSVAAIQGVPMVKTIMPDFKPKAPNTLFSDLLPYFVVQTAQAFRERQEQFLAQRISEPIRMLNAIWDKFLLERCLPACIESHTTQKDALPPSLLLNIEEIKELGGNIQIERSREDIRKLALQCRNNLEGAKLRLQKEQNEDRVLREMYGTQRWTRASSEEVSSVYVDDVAKNEQLFAVAQNGDQEVEKRYALLQNDVELLCKCSSEEILMMMPKDADSETDIAGNSHKKELEKKISELESLLSEGKLMKNERAKMIEVAEMKSSQMRVLPKVIEEYRKLDNSGSFEPSDEIRAKFEKLYERHISGFDNELKVLEAEKSKQKRLETEVAARYEEFVSLQKDDTVSDSKQSFFLQLQMVHSNYMKLVQDVKEGLQFYNSFLVITSNLLKSIDDFCASRSEEARELESEITNSSFNPDLISPRPQKPFR